MNKIIRGIIPAVFIFFLSPIGTLHAAPILKLHSEGHDVTVLQQLLLKGNYTVSVTGIFDESTQKTVKAFQADNNLPDTGIVDRKTWWLLTGEKDTGRPASVSAAAPISPVGNHIAAKPQTTASVYVPPVQKKSASAGTKKPQSEAAAIAAIRARSVPETPVFLPSGKVGSIISTAKKYMGTPYIYGGETPKGFDCSGYLQYIFKQNNIIIPRTADEQYKIGKKVPVNQLQPGDLVFFSTDLTDISHCGIYLGSGQFIHASTSKGVRIDRLDNDYWKNYFIGGKHIVK
ncbi:C40 family peptidase [Pectinatus haikarae]|uniref:C40 family peptidase n=1 Tax=Pectinatus haikarae TaxID=349096 RepID=UPI001E62001C|nr:NlpC/P60 family protein [Pectinatus haikarae]